MAESKSKTKKELLADHELSQEQLDEVVGGMYPSDMISDDSCFLNVLLRGRPCQPDRYGEYKCRESPDRAQEVARAWASIGIRVIYNQNQYPDYLVEGNPCRQEDAYRHAMKVVGKKLKKSDWYWD